VREATAAFLIDGRLGRFRTDVVLSPRTVGLGRRDGFVRLVHERTPRAARPSLSWQIAPVAGVPKSPDRVVLWQPPAGTVCGNPRALRTGA
jgi:hypothetical protein